MIINLSPTGTNIVASRKRMSLHNDEIFPDAEEMDESLYGVDVYATWCSAH